MVLSVASRSSRKDALNWLCERYWYPLYAFIRRRGYPPDSAQDLTQGFLTNLLERSSFEAADPSRGRFRAYLIGALKHYLADRTEYETAAKRGGGEPLLPLPFEEGEEHYLQCPAHLTPEALYDRQWALSLIDRVLDLLHAEHAAAGKESQFGILKPFLAGEGDFRAAASALAMKENAVRVAVHRLRRRYRDLLSAEITETVDSPDVVQQEIRYLIHVISA
ncbi:MAG TPA: RNA polymerase subunit sigma-24 [Solibacterales bacterium]|nr:RNA polymerase subunit sigma-24 [Bryobacterales bacterium]